MRENGERRREWMSLHVNRKQVVTFYLHLEWGNELMPHGTARIVGMV